MNGVGHFSLDACLAHMTPVAKRTMDIPRELTTSLYQTSVLDKACALCFALSKPPRAGCYALQKKAMCCSSFSQIGLQCYLLSCLKHTFFVVLVYC